MVNYTLIEKSCGQMVLIVKDDMEYYARL